MGHHAPGPAIMHAESNHGFQRMEGYWYDTAPLIEVKGDSSGALWVKCAPGRCRYEIKPKLTTHHANYDKSLEMQGIRLHTAADGSNADVKDLVAAKSASKPAALLST